VAHQQYRYARLVVDFVSNSIHMVNTTRRHSTLLLCFAFAAVSFAQTRDTAAVFGVVSDSQGAAIPDAAVTMTSVATSQVRKLRTSDTGQYLFSSLPIGGYSIVVEHPSFKRYERTGILLQANDNVKVDIALEIGDIKTTVSIVDTPPQVETRSSTLKETIDRARVVELPLNGRNAADLALLAPGVTAFASNNGDVGSNIRPRGTKEFSVNVEQLIVPAISLERDVEEVPKQRHGSGERFNADVHQHACDRDARDIQLNGSHDDVQRDQRIEHVANARNQADDTGDAEAETARNREGVIHPAGQRLNIGNARVDDFGRQNRVRLSGYDVRCDSVRHAAAPSKEIRREPQSFHRLVIRT
jgi:hypothetical protein